MDSFVFLALAPAAALLMMAVAVVAWRRRASPGGSALSLFSVVSLAWLASDALSLLAPTAQSAVARALVAFAWAPLLGPAWLAFVLAYTEQMTPRWRLAVAAVTAWYVGYAVLVLTNGVHGLVWTSWQVVPAGSLLRVAYRMGVVGWAHAAVSWLAIGASLVMLQRAYAAADARTRRLSRWLVVGALVPLSVNIACLLWLGAAGKDFTPIAMAVSSGAFALGLVRYRLLDLRPIARAALVDSLRDGVLVLDAQGRVADTNPALAEALGPEGVRVGHLLAETCPALAEALAAAPDAVFRLGEGEAARAFDLRVSPLADREGRPGGHLVLLHDVTRRRAERAALRRANAHLYHANTELQARNDELDAFAHTVAHDLKTPIQGVLGFAEVLRDDGPTLPPDVHRELATDVVRAAQKMSRIVDELLLLAGVRQAAVETRPVAMSAVVDEALARASRAHPSLSHARRPEAWPAALGHAPWIEEVWANYLINAAKYGGPAVTLGASATASGHVRFWVHDDGPPLAPEAQARLFLPFSRIGAPQVEGHGLGLSIVRRIAERLGGTCGVESAPGAGNRFWFALPPADAPPADAPWAQPAAEPPVASDAALSPA